MRRHFRNGTSHQPGADDAERIEEETRDSLSSALLDSNSPAEVLHDSAAAVGRSTRQLVIRLLGIGAAGSAAGFAAWRLSVRRRNRRANWLERIRKM